MTAQTTLTIPTARSAMRDERRPVVCQVLHTLEIGGAEVLAAALARRLSDQFRFRFACLDGLGTLGKQLIDEGYPVEVIGRGSGLDRGCLRRLAEQFRIGDVDLIHAHQYTPTAYSLMSRWPRRRPPVLFTEHGRHSPDLRRWKRVAANRVLFRADDRVICVGHAVRDAVVRNEGIPASKVGVIHNGIDLERFAQVDPDPEAVRRELGLEADDLVLILVARLDYLKDHGTALSTMAALTDRLPKARLLLVGDGPERGAIEAQIAEQGLGDRVRLLGTRRDVPRLVAASDIVLLTSISEGIPLTLIEAMAASRPVVSTDVGGVSEVVEPGRTGLLAPAGDPQGLASRIVELAGDPERRRELGLNGRRRAEQHFDQRAMHASYANLYREMLHHVVDRPV